MDDVCEASKSRTSSRKLSRNLPRFVRKWIAFLSTSGDCFQGCTGGNNYDRVGLSGSDSESTSSRSPLPHWTLNSELTPLEVTDESNKHIFYTRKAARLSYQRSAEQRDLMRSMASKKDWICLQRVQGKIINILDGLELHKEVFSAKEQTKIVEYVYLLQKMGQQGGILKGTYTKRSKWKPWGNKEYSTLQFGCCYNYLHDNQFVDPLPPIFKDMIYRLVRWGVIQPNCVPDSCIVEISEDVDSDPLNLSYQNFVPPYCLVSFRSESLIKFGMELDFASVDGSSDSIPIRLPVRSVLVLKGNSADIAKHRMVNFVRAKRISIVFMRMDESKRPARCALDPALQNIQPLSLSSPH